jgi:type I restriction enzyme M protein
VSLRAIIPPLKPPSLCNVPPRKTSSPARNKYCVASDLTNEASVEAFFIVRLLQDFGYHDNEILTKASINDLPIPRGSSTEQYRPDYVIACRGKPRWLIDAKSPTERVEEYTYQGAGYALEINRKTDDKPLRYFMLTNGLLTRVYPWDHDEPVLSLRFGDFDDGNPKYRALKALFSAEVVRSSWPSPSNPSATHLLTRPPMDQVKKAFLRCHRIIWKSEKMSPQAAFVEFAKVLFVKLWEDRRIRDDSALLALVSKGDPLPLSQVRFSTRWIDSQEQNDPNPLDALLFRQLVDALEQEIAQRRRKRIFEPNERLKLSPGTAKRVVKELHHYYLFGIDEDLNGRMFEAFLAATMRGQALGQYFTPRSIVKLMTRLANLRAGRGPEGITHVIDACCGTGGFLIEALTEMRRQIWDNRSLSSEERTYLLDQVANHAIFGIDAGRDPMIARIARINMYLHGDGGSRVYMADALRHPPEPSLADTPEVKSEVEELRNLLDAGTKFEVVLTNPPFSMDYSASVPEEKEVLDTYDLSSYSGKRRSSLRSSVMFLERYWQLLAPGGRLLTVIDDSVLGGKNYSFVRDFIRERYVIRAIISLHGDAFQRAGARAKTSVLLLEARDPAREVSQPSAFVYESRHIGLDDAVPRTRASVAELARANALEEIDLIVEAYSSYLRGETGHWLVDALKLTGRLDAKFLRPTSVDDLKASWDARGVTSDLLRNLVDLVEEPIQIDPDQRYAFLRISYEGQAETGEPVLGREISYTRVGRPRVGDIVVSNISAVYKAICVIPPGKADLLVSTEFTVLRPKPEAKVDPEYLWSVLRSSAVIAQWISRASGVGRHRVDWPILQDQRIPMLPYERQLAIGEMYRQADAHHHAMASLKASAAKELDGLELENRTARDRLATAKPPR